MTRFRMFGIHLDQFAILTSNKSDGDLGMNIELSYKYADKGKKIAYTAGFEFTSQEVKIMILGVTCEFEIHEEDWEKLNNNEEVVIPKELLEYFAVHTVGTARGVLFCKTESTQFNNVIIPPINVADLIKGNLVIS